MERFQKSEALLRLYRIFGILNTSSVFAVSPVLAQGKSNSPSSPPTHLESALRYTYRLYKGHVVCDNKCVALVSPRVVVRKHSGAISIRYLPDVNPLRHGSYFAARDHLLSWCYQYKTSLTPTWFVTPSYSFALVPWAYYSTRRARKKENRNIGILEISNRAAPSKGVSLRNSSTYTAAWNSVYSSAVSSER